MNKSAKTIIHDLKTPLCILDTNAKSLKQLLPRLIDTYHWAKNQNAPITLIPEKQIALLMNIIDSFSRQAYKIENGLNKLKTEIL